MLCEKLYQESLIQSVCLFQPCPTKRQEIHTTVNIFAWLFGSLDTEFEGEETEQMRQLKNPDKNAPKPVCSF